MNKQLAIFFSLLSMVSTMVFADGDAAAGKNKAGACMACHGMDGNSSNPIYPSLAGQHANYIERQLQLFKNGGRNNAIMAGMVAALSEQDMADLAAFYASQSIKPAAANPELAGDGKLIYRGGLPGKDVPACMACHGPAGDGNGPAGYPTLAGQKAAYIEQQLKLFRDGMILGEGADANAVMSRAAAGLSDDDIKAVASYIQGLH